MDEFGVTSENLKKIAKHPGIPTLGNAANDTQGQTYKWYGATLKNVETEGEQSAAGLSETSGIILLEVPVNSAFAKSGLKVGDVILYCQDVKSKTSNNCFRLPKIFSIYVN